MIRFAMVLGMLLMATAPVLAQDAGTCVPNQGHPILRPIMLTHTLPPYPTLASHMEEEGTTLVMVRIGPDGVPIDVTVDKSSGVLRLDQAAVAHVSAVWKWQPPLGADCAPTTVRTRVSINWHLLDRERTGQPFIGLPVTLADFPPGALARKEQGLVLLTAKLLPNGALSRVDVDQSSGFPDLDAKALEIAKARFHPAAESRAIPVSLSILLVWTLPSPGKR